MGNLSNLYISQSFISLLHFGSNSSASAALTEIQDGLGYSTGISMNNSGDLAVGGALTIGGGLTLSGSVRINTIYTSSTPQYVNSGNQYTDNIIRVTGSFASGSPTSPTLNEVQVGWPVFGEGLVSGAVVTNKVYIPATGWQFTINQNTAVWFGLYNFTNPTPSYLNFSVSGSEDITGSLWVRDNFNVNNISASGNISASNLWIKGRISAYELDVTIESSSIIFTSGSNILGDEANIDTQTLIGRVRISGSLEVTGSTRINGNVDSTGSLKVTSDISSSTLNGIGNVTLFSQSVDSRLDVVEATASLYVPFSTSVDSRLDLVEATSSFLRNTFSASQYKADSSSFDTRIDSLEAFSASIVTNFATVLQLNTSSSVLQSNINTKLDTASFNSYTSSISSSNSLVSQSFVTTISNLSASIYLTDSTQSNNINSLIAKTGSYATTGSNNFTGNQTITGSLVVSSSADVDFTIIGKSVYSGSVRGNVIPLTIVSNTASLDCSLGNFYTLTLISGSQTLLTATNINPGQTLSVKVLQSATGYGTLVYNGSIKFSQYSPYVATPVSSSVDIISFQSYDTTALYGGAVNKLV